MRIIDTERIPIMIWTEQIEEGALVQAKNLANVPYAYNHIAIMPDCHQGYGMPIGGVMAAAGAIVPNAVGVDIGCGMCAVRTSLETIQKSRLKSILEQVRQAVPVGFTHHKYDQDEGYMPERKGDLPVAEREYGSALRQIGTLGGGNHFIEIQKGSDGRIWIMVHSGSRNIGKQVADHYNLAAVRNAEKWDTGVPKAWQLACLPEGSKEAKQYQGEMQFCVDFAFNNRKLMMDRILEILSVQYKGDIAFDPMVNIAHNYAARENHYHRSLFVHRKGATRALPGQTGIIPGSQGSASYVVRGKGNPQSFMSCSHGAGRRMGRKQAVRELSFNEEVRKLEEKGILHSIRSKKDLDEAGGAYKDIDKVMADQEDLVDIVVRLAPLGVIKG